VTKAACIGASNGDKPEFFDLFVSAMDNINTQDTRKISSTFSQQDKNSLKSADLILLAGGDFVSGWEVLQRTGMDKIVSK